MLLIGLTGSIATGKSTVSQLLTSPPYSLPLVDADVLARQVVEPGTYGYRRVVSYFSASTPDLLLPADAEGRQWLNRPALGRRIFGDSKEAQEGRKALNGIVHPLVRLAMVKSVLWWYATGREAVVLDVPLLFESELDIFTGSVVVVAVRDPKIQMARLQARDAHLSPEDAENRVRSQTPIAEKVKRVEHMNLGSKDLHKGGDSGRGYVIFNDQGREELETEVEIVMARIKKSNPRWWSWVLLLFPPGVVLLSVWRLWRNWLERRRWEVEQRREKAEL